MDSQNKKPLNNAALLQFIDQLIDDKKDPNIRDDNRNEVREMLLKEVKNTVNLRLVQMLSEEDQDMLDKMLERNCSDEELDTFLLEKIPSIDTETAAALLDFKAAYLSTPPQESKES